LNWAGLSKLIFIDIYIAGSVGLGNCLLGSGMNKKVMVDFGALSGASADDDRGNRAGQKSVVVNKNRITRNVGAVISVGASVHIEAVAVGIFEDKIVACFVTGAGPAGAGDVVAAPVEQIALNQCIRLVKTNAITQAATLVMVDIVMVDMCFGCAAFEKYGCVTEAP